MKVIFGMLALWVSMTNLLVSQDTTICAFPIADTLYSANEYSEWNYSLGVHSENAIVIPVVVHVMRDINASQSIQDEQNISDAQILSQINVLNEDFRRLPGTSGYGNGADMKIEFRLADRDPDNNSTTGITRHAVAKWNYVVSGSNFKGSYLVCDDINTYLEPVAWDPEKYLNIWIVPSLNSENTKGIGIFPWKKCSVDGVIVDYQWFGDEIGTTFGQSPSVIGRTGTHEVGHYLGLYHVFQGGCINDNCEQEGDAVCDTPPQDNYLSCNASTACQNTSTPLVENYMQYTHDACMNMFTEGQSVRVNKIFNAYRSALNNQDALTSSDFVIFGIHAGVYDYNVTTRIIAKSSTPYSQCNVPDGNTVELRARQEIVFEPGFIAELGSEVHAHIDAGLPSFPKKNLYLIDNTTHLDNDKRKLITQITPNPVSKDFIVDYILPIDGQYTLEVTDLYGIRVQFLVVNTNIRAGTYSTTVNIENLSSGTYFIHIKTECESDSEKIIISH